MPLPSSERTSLPQRLHYLARLAQQLRRAARQGPAALAAALPDLERLTLTLNALQREVQDLTEAHHQLLALTHVAHAINSSLDLDTVLQLVMDHIIQLTQAERGFLMLRDETGALRTVTARNWEQETLPAAEIAFSRSVVDQVVQSGEPVLTINAQQDPRFRQQESVALHGLRSIMCVPLKVRERLVGVIYTDNRLRSGVFTPEHQEMLLAFADQAATALENARLFGEVRRTLAAVTELKNLLDHVFASIASGVITVNAEERISLCNRAAERILGLPTPQLVGRPWHQALAPLAPTLRAHWQRVLQEGQEVVGLEVAPEWPQRGRVYWQISLAPLRDENQRPQGVTLVINDLTEQRRLEHLRHLFERMVSPAVIDQLNLDRLQVGGERRVVTTLFADVRGFTAFGERVSSEELVSVLNRYLALAAEALLDEAGTVDKFMGDAVMAWFNAPMEQPDHALRAVRAAWHIQERLADLHAQLPPEQHLGFGIGIHTGEVVMGLIGTERRLDYTVIGDSVNTAKRLEEAAQAGQVLVSAATYRLIQDQVTARPLPPWQAKGKRQAIPVYEILGLK